MTQKQTVTATGDALITIRMPEYQDDDFTRMVEMIQSCDIAFTNLEVVLSDYRGTPVVENGGGNISAHPDVARDLMRMGFNLTAFANNHTLNYGEYGCTSTLEALAEMGFTCAGAGWHLDEARAPAYLDSPVGRIGLVGCASTFADGQRAGLEYGGVPGRPGLNPQRFDSLFVVNEEHLDAIRTIAERTGAEKMRQHLNWLGWPQDPKREGEVRFAGQSFIAGDEWGVRTEAHEGDLEANMRSMREARNRSDLTLMSIHAHEASTEKWLPAEFIVDFAHASIDNGADMVIGHGPHVLRGIEIYKGKPIFYSLGNFIYQFELLQRLAPDDYDLMGIDLDKTVSELFDEAFDGGKRSFPADHLYWESVLPICTYEDRRLTGLELHPLDLGYGHGLPRRGIPRLAERDLGDRILNWMVELSEPFGTEIRVQDGVGYVEVD